MSALTSAACADDSARGRIRAAGLRCVGALLCLLSAATAGAQTVYTWTGAVSGDWGTPGNWSPNGVPGEYASLTLFKTSVNGVG